jgi:O-antigen/teichoic acid export membrane protein
MSEHLIRAAKLIFVLILGLFAGVAVAFALAIVGHEILVLIYGQDLAPIDDTPPMFAVVWTCYLAGIVSALVIIAIGWRRFVRR